MVFNKGKRTTSVVVAIVIEILAIIFSFFTFFTLNENQLLYLSSTGAQVIASLLGLTITGYIFFEPKLDEEVREDDTLLDTINSLKSLFRKYLLEVGIISFAAITSCVINIILGSSTILAWRCVNNFMLNNAVILFFLSIIEIGLFVWTVLDPNRNKKISDLEKQAAETDYKKQSENDVGETEGDLSEFLKTYIEIEKTLEKISNKIFAEGSWHNNSGPQKRSVHLSLKMLSSIGVISSPLLSEIDYLRRYRNLVVHSSEATVTETACKNARKILNELKVLCEELNI